MRVGEDHVGDVARIQSDGREIVEQEAGAGHEIRAGARVEQNRSPRCLPQGQIALRREHVRGNALPGQDRSEFVLRHRAEDEVARQGEIAVVHRREGRGADPDARQCPRRRKPDRGGRAAGSHERSSSQSHLDAIMYSYSSICPGWRVDTSLSLASGQACAARDAARVTVVSVTSYMAAREHGGTGGAPAVTTANDPCRRAA